MNENGAFCDLVDRYSGIKAIFIADRGYESYNGFEHVVHSGNKYLIRVRDITSKCCITQTLGPYPEKDEFDIDVFRKLTIKQTKETKANTQLYKFFPKTSRFDYMNKENPFYDFNCRIVRFKISEDGYETIITNLDRNEFNPDEIKKLYNMRWSIETSFRLVKYALDLNAFHAKKRKLIKQEIYARLIIYNMSQRVIRKVKISNNKTKYLYQINFTRAFHIIREFFHKKTGDDSPQYRYCKNHAIENGFNPFFYFC